MKLTQNQKVAIYGSALQGMLACGHADNLAPNRAVEVGNSLIDALEAMPDEETEQPEPVNNASGH